MAESAVLSWIESVSGQAASGSGQDFLKNGAVLCRLVNALRANTIRKINTYTSAFRSMENIDNFLKVAKACGTNEDDLFSAEDLFYGNNYPKVLLGIAAFSVAASEKFDCSPVDGVDLDEMRSVAESSQVEGGKVRSKDIGLSLFEQGARKAQSLASEECKVGDKISGGSKEKAIASADLGMLEANSRDAQKMISSAKKSATDNIIKSTETAVASAELGVFDRGSRESQKMISEAKKGGTDAIIKSRDEAIASADLGVFDRGSQESQKMISEAKKGGTDAIIKSREEAIATADLGIFDSGATESQKMISASKAAGTDQIIKQGGELTTAKSMGGDDSVDLDF